MQIRVVGGAVRRGRRSSGHIFALSWTFFTRVGGGHIFFVGKGQKGSGLLGCQQQLFTVAVRVRKREEVVELCLLSVCAGLPFRLKRQLDALLVEKVCVLRLVNYLLPEAELGRVRQGPSVNAARLPAAFPLGQCGRRLCRGSQLYQEGGDEISAFCRVLRPGR
jgi:hypothetical protein